MAIRWVAVSAIITMRDKLLVNFTERTSGSDVGKVSLSPHASAAHCLLCANPEHILHISSTLISPRVFWSDKEALRCLKLSISDVIYRQFIEDAAAAAANPPVCASPGGRCGVTRESSAAYSHSQVLSSSCAPVVVARSGSSVESAVVSLDGLGGHDEVALLNCTDEIFVNG